MRLSAKEKLGWKGIFKVLRGTHWRSDIVWSTGITLFSFFLLAWSWEWRWLDLLNKATKSLLSLYGGLLGISMAAYALLLGMPHLKRIMGIVLPGKSSSLYAQTHAQFTLCLLLQLFSLLGVLITSLLLGSGATRRSTDFVCLDKVINALILFILLFSFLYQVILMKDTFILIYNGAIYAEAISETNSEE